MTRKIDWLEVAKVALLATFALTIGFYISNAIESIREAERVEFKQRVDKARMSKAVYEMLYGVNK
ncbi:hypothetical protein JDW15_09960 [Aerococcaceae bacterium zg-ZJ1578]|uniref:hypothetical protein n=1 Tax=Aerococcaceae bacterium zg-252 TaxID=2796928 RepID=UPI001A2822F3|nr:hypothetical protein [Aerococcaceae bacterium zg-1578]